MNVLVEVNIDTGAATMYRDQGITGRTAIATQSGQGSQWELTNNGTTFRRQLNKARGSNTITDSDAKKIFYKGANGNDGENFQLQGNKQRAAVLNRNATVNAREYMVAKRNLPFVSSTKSGTAVNSKGQVINSSTGVAVGTQPPAPVLPVIPPDPEDPTVTTISPNSEVTTQGTSKEFPQFKGGGDLRYPLGAPPAGFPFDFIRIAAVKYVPSSLDYIINKTSNPGAVSRYSGQSEVSSVILPMQPNLSESHSVGWGGDSLDPFRALLANASLGAINGLGSGATGAQIIEQLGEVGSDLIERAGDMISDKSTLSFVAAYFAGQAVGANVSGRLTGQVINPNMELLFSGPTLRTFNFNFRMTPRSDTEAEMVKKIIRSFKMNMAVQRSDSNLFLRSPNIFKLKYISGDGSDATQQHPFLNKFKPCAMTSFNVNYTPDGSYMTFENKSLTAYDMSLSFSELEPIYQDDYAEAFNTHADMGF